MFEDILTKKTNSIDGKQPSSCEDCDYASYILSNYHKTRVLCQIYGRHKLFGDLCEKWQERKRVKPHQMK